jgi:hypothetical protein
MRTRKQVRQLVFGLYPERGFSWLELRVANWLATANPDTSFKPSKAVPKVSSSKGFTSLPV